MESQLVKVASLVQEPLSPKIFHLTQLQLEFLQR